jgi:hypothetical protein
MLLLYWLSEGGIEIVGSTFRAPNKATMQKETEYPTLYESGLQKKVGKTILHLKARESC